MAVCSSAVAELKINRNLCTIIGPHGKNFIFWIHFTGLVKTLNKRFCQCHFTADIELLCYLEVVTLVFLHPPVVIPVCLSCQQEVSEKGRKMTVSGVIIISLCCLTVVTLSLPRLADPTKDGKILQLVYQSEVES